MKPYLLLLAIATMAGAPMSHAQSIKVSQTAAPVALTQSAQPDAKAQSVAIHRVATPNWARVVATRGADGKLTARCIVEPNPEIAANKRANQNTNRKHRK